MIPRALLAWLLLLLLAILNGAFRQGVLIPRVGDVAGHIVSTLLLSALILAATWLLLPWIRPVTTGEALMVGALWVVLTLAFEFLAGHYLFHKPWPELLADYDIAKGRIWPLVLLVTLLAPLIVQRVRG